MYSKILDQKTYLAVVGAAPENIHGEYEWIAREIVNILDQGMGNEADYYSVSISKLAEKLALQVPDISPSMIGRIIGQLGLLKERRRDGYYVFYSAEQIEILVDALKLNEVSNAS